MIPIGSLINHRSLMLAKHAPSILFVGGLAGSVTSTILACRATLKLEETLEEAQEAMKEAKSLEHYTKSRYEQQRVESLVYIHSAVKLTKLYAPAVIIGGISIMALTKSHNLLTSRVIALTAAYSALEKGFDEYRGRVIDKYGVDEDRELRHGVRDVEIVDPETGKKTTIKAIAPDGPSIYAKFFDQYSIYWSKEPEYNLVYLKCQQNYANDMLHARGHMFLNEVYDMLGIERSEAGAVIGWIMSPNGDTDNYINFGLDENTDNVRDFVNGRESAILLDFNVDGLIFDKIGVHRKEISWQKS